MHSFSSGIADGKASSVVLRTNIPAPNQILEGIEALITSVGLIHAEILALTNFLFELPLAQV
jgi:hypothetical protein